MVESVHQGFLNSVWMLVFFVFIPEFKRPYYFNYFNGRRPARQHRGNCDNLINLEDLLAQSLGGAYIEVVCTYRGEWSSAILCFAKKYFHCMLENLTRINNGNIFGRPAPRSSWRYNFLTPTPNWMFHICIFDGIDESSQRWSPFYFLSKLIWLVLG